MKTGLDPFVLALLGMILLAKWWPEGGLGEGPWSLEALAGYGVSVIFFLYGLKLGPEKLKAGLGHFRLHLLVQTFTFVVFPLLLLAVRPFFRETTYEQYWLGAYFLAALPSTVSSSVVMVSIAGGNIPAAIFNASISSLLGIFITPLWMQLALSTGPGSLDLGPVIVKLLLQVLLPVIAGMILHRWWGGFADRNKKGLRYFDQAIILCIVYTAFCDAFHRHVFDALEGTALIGLFLAMAALFWIVYGLMQLACRWQQLDRADTITAQFCGSKKSLVHGTVMSKVLFAGNPMTAILLLPLMIYHALQLVLVSILAGRFKRKSLVV
ncbi:bile acid:sodium symporter family protein [Flavihumibacter petaseus]|uniref:Putative BASS family transporter n=1 Tax=Flavihumibacter petaseus NBRC 106054 TaxID=1220578 RepID=A0A0E9MU93_9BACT|nr:bile acid:sodium symporter family protein [Flavihumibacter petaseus]GAO41139.1 putative BASS family transporter [Flavihumibacter petaseus NBRC 106054]